MSKRTLEQTEDARSFFKNMLYSDVEAGGLFYNSKPLLAHYCTVSTAEKIISSNEIWLSNPLFMNDVEEVRFCMVHAAAIFRKYLSSSANESDASRIESVGNEFESLYSDFDGGDAMHVYAFCMSEHDVLDDDGKLSMWRGYGENGKGVALVLDGAKVPLNPDSPFILAKVQYMRNEERLQWIDNTTKIFLNILINGDFNSSCIQVAVFEYFERVKLFALFTKHLGFSEEAEWRFVYLKSRDLKSVQKSNMSYWVGLNGIEPKLKIKVDSLVPSVSDAKVSDFIDRVILGPSLSTALAKAAFVRMLEIIGKEEIVSRVKASTIPFRS